MTVHISARRAWHDDGWNGRFCRRPERNTFCVGTHSYPGQLIGERRRLDWETANAGKSFAKLDGISPCCFSVNAFYKVAPPHFEQRCHVLLDEQSAVPLARVSAGVEELWGERCPLFPWGRPRRPAGIRYPPAADQLIVVPVPSCPRGANESRGLVRRGEDSQDAY